MIHAPKDVDRPRGHKSCPGHRPYGKTKRSLPSEADYVQGSPPPVFLRTKERRALNASSTPLRLLERLKRDTLDHRSTALELAMHGELGNKLVRDTSTTLLSLTRKNLTGLFTLTGPARETHPCSPYPPTLPDRTDPGHCSRSPRPRSRCHAPPRALQHPNTRRGWKHQQPEHIQSDRTPCHGLRVACQSSQHETGQAVSTGLPPRPS
jgi:hypothetical protein